MYKILVCCATSNELKVAKKKIKSLSLPLKVDFLQLGIWNYNTIFSLTKRLSEKDYDFLINVGACWIRSVTSRKLKVESSQPKAYIVEDDNNLWLSSDIQSPKYLKNFQIPFYQVGNIFDYETWKELIVPVFFKFWPLKTCISANKPIEDLEWFRIDGKWWKRDEEWLKSHAELVSAPEKTVESGKLKVKNEYSSAGIIKGNNSFLTSWDFSDLFLLDMESFGFEFVSEKFNLPRIILKVPVDTTAEELDKFDFKRALEKLENNIDYEKLIVEVKDFLDKNKKTDEFEKYCKVLPFSVSQKENFKFLVRKYQFVIGGFDKFFYDFVKQNKELSPKQITKKLLKTLKEQFDMENLTKK